MTATDASGAQTTHTISVAVTGDDPPVTAPTAPYNTPAGANLNLRGTGLSVSDPDGGSNVETATLSVGEGILTIAAGNSGVTILNGNGTGTVTFSGTVAQIDALLNTSSGTVVYNDNAASPGASTTLTLTITNASNLSESASSTIDVAAPMPVLNSFTLNISEGGTVVLSDSNFSVTHQSPADFFSLQAGSVVGGEFQVYQGGNWVSAPTGGFYISQIEAGQVRFVQDGSETAPKFSIWVSDGVNASPAIAPTVSFTDPAAPPVVTASAQPINEDGTGTLALAFTNATNVFENGENSVTVKVSLDHGATLSQTGNGAAVTDNHDGTFTLTAHSVADLAGLTITPASWFVGKVDIAVSAVTNDGTAVSVAGTTSTTLTVNTAEVPPVVSFEGAPSETVTIPPDNLQHFVFPNLTISESGTTIDHAAVTWSGFTSGTISFAGLTFGGLNGNVAEGITVTLASNGHEYDFTGTASLAAYQDVLSHLTLNSWDPESPTFAVTVNDGTLDSVPATSTVDVAVPVTWDVWTGNGDDSDNWNDTGNWSLDHAPGESDYAYVNTDGAITDDLFATRGDQTVKQLHILGGAELDINSSSSPSYTFDVTGAENIDGQYFAAVQNLGTIDVRNATLRISGNTENTGAIEAHGAFGVVSFDAVTVDQSGSPGGTITADNGGQVNLNGTTIDNGALMLGEGGTLNVFAANSETTLDGVAVTGTNGNADRTTSTISVGADDAAILLLEDGATVTNGELTIGSGSALDVAVGPHGSGGIDGPGPDATLDGVGVNAADSTSTIEVMVGATLQVDGTTFTNGALTIDTLATFAVEFDANGSGAKLDGVAVTDAGNVQVDSQVIPTITLTLDDGTTVSGVSGGKLTIGPVGVLDVEVGPNGQGGGIPGNPDATLDGVTVINGHVIEIGETSSGAIFKFDDGTSVAGGTLDIAGGSTLDVETGVNGAGNPDATLDGVTVINGHVIEIGETSSGVIFKFDDGTSVAGGALDIASGSTLDVETGVNGASNPDAALQGVTVNAADTTSAIEIGLSTSFATLLLDGGAVLNGGTMTIGGGSTLDVELAGLASSDPDATLNGVTVNTTDSSSTIEVGLSTVGAVLLLEGGTTINGSALTIGSGSTLDIEVAGATSSNPDATLNGVSVTGVDAVIGDSPAPASLIDVGLSSAATLLMDDGATITHGAMTIGSTGVLDVEIGPNSDSSANPDATLDGVSVINNNAIDIAETSSGAIFTFEHGTTVTGGTMSIGNYGTLDIEFGISGHPAATLDGVSVNSSEIGTIKVGTMSTATLLLDDGATITHGSLTIGQHGTLDAEIGPNGPGGINGGPDATLDGVNVTNNHAIDIGETSSGVTFTFDDGTQVTGGTLSIGSNSTLQILDNGSNTVGATLDDVSVTDLGTIQVGSAVSGDPTLTLQDGTTITGGDDQGKLTIGSGDTLDIEAGANGPGATLNNLAIETADSTSTIKLGSGSTLTLVNSFFSGGTIEFTGNGDTFVMGAGSHIGSAVVTGFGAGDEIDLAGVSFVPNEHVVWTQTSTIGGGTGTLQIFNGSGVLEKTLNLDGIYSQNQFVLADDQTASHGTDVKFNNISFFSGTINHNGNVAPLIENAGSSIQLTDGNNSEASSWFANTRYSTASFTASFDYKATGNFLADGMAFILQNSSAGTNALGRDGSSLGYGALENTSGGAAISPSVAVEFNVYGGNGAGTAFATNGGVLGYTPTGDVAFWNGDEIQAVISYNGTVLTETLTDLLNGATYTASETIDIASVLGSNTAYVGFSAATGGAASTQVVSNFSFSNGGPVTGGGSDTFVYAKGDGAVTISGFDQDNNCGTFDPKEGDQIVLNGLSNPLSLTQVGANTVANFGNGDVLTLLNVTPAEVQSVSEVLLVPPTAVTETGNINAGTLNFAPSSSQFYHLAGANISGSGGAGISIQGADTAASDTIRLDIDSASSISVSQSGASGINFTSAGANIDLVSNASNVTSANVGISVTEHAAGDITLISTGNINAGSTGIAAQDNASTISASANSLIFVSAFGTINAGTINLNSNNAASGIWAGYGNSFSPLPNVNGTVVVDNNANVTATETGSSGILAFDWGNGDVTVNDGAGTTVSGIKFGIEAVANDSSSGSGDVTINLGQNDTVSSSTSYGIFAQDLDNQEGNITITMATGDVVNSGSIGVNAYDGATSLASGSIVVNSAGTINSGTNPTGTNNPPAGIIAGYLGGSTDPTSYPIAGLNGNVLVNNSADINAAAGDGIRAFTYGTGNVTVYDTAGTIVALFADHTGYNATNGSGFGDGISAQNYGTGDTDVTTAAQAFIESGGSGIAANNGDNGTPSSPTPSSSDVDVLAYGTIHSGINDILTGSGRPPAGILAGYNFNNTVEGNVHGNVIIDDHASITADAGTDGIRGYNYGTGNVTVTVESDAIIDGARYGASAFVYGGGNISLTNYGSVTGGTDAIDVNVTSNGGPAPNGTATIDNHGHLIGDIVAYNATLTNEFIGGDWSLNGTSTFTGTSTLTNAGTIESNGTSAISGLASNTNTGTIEVQSGSLHLSDAVSGTGTLLIDAGATLDFASGVSSGQTVVFNDATGTMMIDDPVHFAGEIAGIAGAGDVLDFHDFAAGTTTATTGSGSFVGGFTTLTVTDLSNGGLTETFKLVGDYSNSSWTVSDDHHGGADIVDPPSPASQPVVASAPNPTPTGRLANDNFAFNFGSAGNATVTDFHPGADLLQSGRLNFAYVDAALNATTDDGHGHTLVGPDAHDAIALSGVLKAQLHTTDFHVV